MKNEIISRILNKIEQSSGVIFSAFVAKNLISYGKKFEIEEMRIDYMKELYKKWLDESNLTDDQKIFIISSMSYNIKQFKNIYSIISKSLDNISEKSSPENLDEDWISLFIEKAKIINSNELQLIFSKILAEAAEDNNMCSKTLLHSLSLMNSSQALAFQNLCRFCFRTYNNDYSTDHIDVYPIIFYMKNQNSYKNEKITRYKLSELSRFGLIDVNYNNEYSLPSSAFPLIYGTHIIEYNGLKNISAGNVILTYDGYLLYKAIDKINNKDSKILDFTYEIWKNRNYNTIIR